MGKIKTTQKTNTVKMHTCSILVSLLFTLHLLNVYIANAKHSELVLNQNNQIYACLNDNHHCALLFSFCYSP